MLVTISRSSIGNAITELLGVVVKRVPDAAALVHRIDAQHQDPTVAEESRLQQERHQQRGHRSPSPHHPMSPFSSSCTLPSPSGTLTSEGTKKAGASTAA